MNPQILLIDDDAAFNHKMKIGFNNYDINTTQTIENFQKALKKNSYDLILLDLKLNPKSDNLEGLNLIEPIKADHPDIPLIVVTADETTEIVVTAMKRGADDFLRKSEFDLLAWKNKFDLHIKNRILSIENKHLKSQKAGKYPFIGNSTAIKEIKKTLSILAEKSDITILITGETGVGKEVAARYLHQYSKRRDKPFVPVNLSSIQETLLESSLFGHKKGAFTGADYEREGYFRKANSGILFLDEIGDINSNLQIKLLRFLDTKTIQVVGDEKDIELDIQIVVATNKKLKKYIDDDKFRSDLYYRIKNFEVEIPPIRHRKKDIESILQHYLNQAGFGAIENILDQDVKKILTSYSWPGNIRELKNAVEASLLKMRIQKKAKVDLACLPRELINTKQEGNVKILIETPVKNELKTHIAQIELKAIEEALIKTFGQKQAAANLLDMTADQMRYKVLKWWEHAPDIVSKFPEIIKRYKL